MSNPSSRRSKTSGNSGLIPKRGDGPSLHGVTVAEPAADNKKSNAGIFLPKSSRSNGSHLKPPPSLSIEEHLLPGTVPEDSSSGTVPAGARTRKNWSQSSAFKETRRFLSGDCQIPPWAFDAKKTASVLRNGDALERFRAAAWTVLYKKSQSSMMALRFRIVHFIGADKRQEDVKSRSTRRKAIDIHTEQLRQFNEGAWKAVKDGEVKVLKKLVEQKEFNPLARGAFGETILHTALLFNRDEIAMFIVDRFPVLINSIYKHAVYKGETAVHMAIVNQNFKMLKFLIRRGAVINGCHATGAFFKREGGTAYYGETPLHFAVCTGQVHMVEYLLQQGARIDDVDSCGNTAFHLCVYYERPDVYDLLYEYGTKHCQTVESLQNRNPPVLCPACGQRLLESKAQLHMSTVHPKVVPPKGWLAAQRRDRDAKASHRRKLTVKDVSELPNDEGYSPKSLAAFEGSSKMLSHLIERSSILGWEWGYVSLRAYPISDIDTTGGGVGSHRVLETIILHGHTELLKIPIIKNLIQFKWEAYCKAMFVLHTIFFLLSCSIFTYVYIATDFNKPIDELNGLNYSLWSVLGLKAASMLFLLVVGFGASIDYKSLCNNFSGVVAQMFANQHWVPLFFRTLVVLSNALLLAGMGAYAQGASERSVLLILSFSLMFEWFYLLKHIMVIRAFGKMIVSVLYIMKSNVFYWIVLYIIMLVSLSAPITRFHGGHTYNEWLLETFYVSIGMEPVYFDAAQYYDEFQLFKFIFGLLHIIVLLNLLIAVMAETINEISRKSELVWLQSFADAVLEMEGRCPEYFRRDVGSLASEAGVDADDPNLRVIPRLIVLTPEEGAREKLRKNKSALREMRKRVHGGVVLESMHAYMEACGYKVIAPGLGISDGKFDSKEDSNMEADEKGATGELMENDLLNARLQTSIRHSLSKRRKSVALAATTFGNTVGGLVARNPAAAMTMNSPSRRGRREVGMLLFGEEPEATGGMRGGV